MCCLVLCYEVNGLVFLHSAMFLLMRWLRYIFVYINSGLGLNCIDNVFRLSFPMFFLCNTHGIDENYRVSVKIEHIPEVRLRFEYAARWCFRYKPPALGLCLMSWHKVESNTRGPSLCDYMHQPRPMNCISSCYLSVIRAWLEFIDRRPTLSGHNDSCCVISSGLTHT